ncbi:ATP-binding cassette domain-containing protein [Gordonia sp. HNM0687]|uniref:ABC-type quaternary amine transporter n=1 Tax=Gordonia mangrovi TaxID=2665643 RepID=A0A6L7GLS2_9ACTN|nr:ABC transporter ATP-binding protein [Gordonia mangrovi]MXP20826.1 ATP-binding cassette domain-containing protein [Gordonia mangrovi]UVF78614.1 ABC transporter ATP-binding protein [Gordonia mangrovi]
MLELDNVAVHYGSTEVIDDLSWSMGTDGSVVTALLGPSGCGKSTLIRAIAGLEALTAGRVVFDDRDLVNTPAHRRDFGVVFQDGQLFGGRSVASNIAYGLRMRRWSRPAIRSRVDEMLDLVRLNGFGDRRVEELSGGQAQRVALARALAPRPRLLLLDEPLAALDRLLRDRLATEISDIVRATATPTVVVTHDHTEAALMADSISVMRAGVLVQTGAPEELWLRPTDEWTARFLGVTTVLAAEVTDGRAVTSLGDTVLDLPDGAASLGLRPESVRAERAVGEDRSLGVVAAVADLPTGRRLRVRTADAELDAITSDRFGVGDQVALVLVPERVAVIQGDGAGIDG